MLSLKNFGITIPVGDLPSSPLRAEAGKNLRGHNWIGRIWARWFRPWLMPSRHAMFKARYNVLCESVQLEFLNAVIEKAEQAILGE